MNRILLMSAAAAGVAALSGCASTYGNLVSGSGVGAMEYQPAVAVKPGGEAVYQQYLAQCRVAAANRQVSVAQNSQLNTIANVSGGALSGAAQGLEMGSILKGAGLGTSVNKSVGIGALAGSMGSLAESFTSGTKTSAAETRSALLTCLRRLDPQSQHYVVVE
ncbi:MAG: hypothetical protein RI907_3376 [Pseudomonadota bacterium]|jgi:hypothetical protein